MGMPRTLPGREQAFRNGSSWFGCSFWAWGQEPDLGLPLGHFLAFVLCLAEWAGSLSGRRLCLRAREAWFPLCSSQAPRRRPGGNQALRGGGGGRAV